MNIIMVSYLFIHFCAQFTLWLGKHILFFCCCWFVRLLSLHLNCAENEFLPVKLIYSHILSFSLSLSIPALFIFCLSTFSLSCGFFFALARWFCFTCFCTIFQMIAKSTNNFDFYTIIIAYVVLCVPQFLSLFVRHC